MSTDGNSGLQAFSRIRSHSNPFLDLSWSLEVDTKPITNRTPGHLRHWSWHVAQLPTSSHISLALQPVRHCIWMLICRLHQLPGRKILHIDMSPLASSGFARKKSGLPQRFRPTASWQSAPITWPLALTSTFGMNCICRFLTST